MFIDHMVNNIEPSGAKKYPMLETFGMALVGVRNAFTKVIRK